ncbi:MAG: RDD family protein [Microvirga sp.]
MGTERWYYCDGPLSVGPFLRDRLVELAQAAIVTPDTLVQREGTDEFVLLSTLLQAKQFPPGPPPLPIVPTALERGGSSLSVAFSDRPIALGPVLVSQTTAADGTAVSSTSQWSATPVAPWRRGAARCLDTLVHGSIGVVLIFFVWFRLAPLSAYRFFAYLEPSFRPLGDLMLSVPIAGIVGAVVVGATGTSVGKAVFGVQVVNSHGEPIGILKCCLREFHIWWKGLALGLPVLSLITMAIAGTTLKRDGSTSWDRRSGTIVMHRPNGRLQYGLNILGIIMIVAAIEALGHIL